MNTETIPGEEIAGQHRPVVADIEDGKVLRDPVAVKERWRAYFEHLLNEDFPRKPKAPAEPVAGPMQPWTVDEVRKTIKKMKAGKATNPGGIPVEAWR
ncbi:hypothetical protein Y032_0119g837 [Ancylostoma ceylanicum]|uniref:Uncharacterized protein n=1 Tax=Ancylostoma ceylanicum TaxID=53326 RepID=A0A016TB79_9BILA|nr:hypothetical protein Y032_0119g837 [Ancylostoma ceylanicum]